MDAEQTLTVDWATAEPVYEQIARQIRARIAAGDLGPGTALPAVRTLASDLGVNLNTVARAYRQLEEQGFVMIRDRAGAIVTAPAATADPASQKRLLQELQSLLQRMRQAGVTATQIRAEVESALEPMDGAQRPLKGNRQ